MEPLFYCLIFYMCFCTILSIMIYNYYYFYYNDIKDTDGKNIHDKYPEFKRYDKKYFTLPRLILGMPFSIPRGIIGVSILTTYYLLLK